MIEIIKAEFLEGSDFSSMRVKVYFYYYIFNLMDHPHSLILERLLIDLCLYVIKSFTFIISCELHLI